jgi:alpha-L-fucosidase
MTEARAKRFVDTLRRAAAKHVDRRPASASTVTTCRPGDNVVPSDVLGEAWEVPATLNHTWGYRSDDHDWKSPQTVIFKLIDIVSKGGNYLLNVGPTAEGVIPQPSQESCAPSERWLKSTAMPSTARSPTPFGDELGETSAKGAKNVRGEPMFLVNTQWRYTAKPGKLFVTFLRRAARAVSAAGDQEPHPARYHLGRRQGGRAHRRGRTDVPEPRSSHPQPHSDGGRRGVRRGQSYK